MNTIELSAGIYKAPECITNWHNELLKRKNGQPDRRDPKAKEFYSYMRQMEMLSIQAMQNNVPFRLMTKSEWWI